MTQMANYIAFQSILLKKLWHLEFHHLRKPEVLIEIGLISIPLLITGLASTRIYLRTKRSWKQREFYNVINISLNTIIRTPTSNGSAHSFRYNLYFRTLMEKELSVVIQNEEGTNQVIEAARRTRQNAESPFVIINDSHLHWSVCNKIANSVSSLCAPAFIHRDIVYHNMLSQSDSVSNMDSKDSVNIASNIESGVYLMALTCEPAQETINAKIRVMLIQDRMVQQLSEDIKAGHLDENSWQTKLENPVHHLRWELIRHIVTAYEQQERTESGRIKWGKPLCDIELCTTSVSQRYESADEYGKQVGNLQARFL